MDDLRVTASKTGLLLDCAYSFREGVEWFDRTSSAADRGTRFHAAIADYFQWGSADKTAPVGEDIADLVKAAIAWDEERSAVYIPEVAFAWDPVTDTAEEIGRMVGRDYSAGKGRLCGSADIISHNGERGYVGDWATGNGEGKGPQLRALALMLARTYGLKVVTVEALEVSAAGVRSVCRQTLDPFDLDVIAGELAEAIAGIPTSEPIPGGHCGEKYCAARLSCPAGKAATAELVDVIPADALVRAKPYRLTDPVTTPEHAAWSLDVIRLVNARLDALKDQIRAQIPEGGWKLDDGRVLREGQTTAHTFSKDKAIALLKELGARDEDIERCSVEYQRSTGLRVSGGTTRRKGKAAA